MAIGIFPTIAPIMGSALGLFIAPSGFLAKANPTFTVSPIFLRSIVRLVFKRFPSVIACPKYPSRVGRFTPISRFDHPALKQTSHRTNILSQRQKRKWTSSQKPRISAGMFGGHGGRVGGFGSALGFFDGAASWLALHPVDGGRGAIT